MSTYDKPLRRQYGWGGMNVATPAAVRRINIPNGIRFVRITDFYANVTTGCTVVTTAAVVEVGDGTTAAKYMAQKIGVDAGSTQAAGTVYGIKDVDGRVAGYKNRIDLLNDGATAGTLQTFLDVTTVAPTGGSPAGVADYYLELEMW